MDNEYGCDSGCRGDGCGCPCHAPAQKGIVHYEFDATLPVSVKACLTTGADGQDVFKLAEKIPYAPYGYEIKQIVGSVVRSPDFAPVKGIYVASRASIPERAAMWRQYRKDGWRITSTWIDEDGPGQTDSMAYLWTRIEQEVKDSRGVVLYVRPEDIPLKGAFIEAGMALAYGHRVYVVAPGFKDHDDRLARIGSWLHHPRASVVSTVEEALSALTRRA